MESHEMDGVVAIVLAGGRGTRLHELTQRECKPALPFARHHRIVDFAMASLVRSGVGRIVVATQYCHETLTRHLLESWAPALPEGGLLLRCGTDLPGEGYSGTTDVLRANAALLDNLNARELLVVAADQVYAMDHARFLQRHRDCKAQITVAAMPVARDEASRFGVITEGPGGYIADFAEKPVSPSPMRHHPDKALASLGLYVVDWPWLRGRLDDPRLQDFGHDVIPMAVGRGEAAVWRWSGYWRDVGTLDGLRESWLDFSNGHPPCPLPLVPGMELPALARMSPRDRFHRRMNMAGLQLLSPLIGSDDPDRWAALDRSVLMPGAHISPGVRLTNVIVAPGTVIPDGMRIGDDPQEDGRWFRVSGGTTLVTAPMLARRAALSPMISLVRSSPPGRTRPARSS